jgi:hypothetical protein
MRRRFTLRNSTLGRVCATSLYPAKSEQFLMRSNSLNFYRDSFRNFNFFNG